MEKIPQGKDMKPTYENFIAGCPWCGRENIFNRATDLKDLDPIDYLEVNCLIADCARPFFINGDLINPAYEMMIRDCYELLERKHHAYCILNLAQAYEVFFSQYLRVELIYRPFASDPDPDKDIRQWNKLISLLYRKTRRLSFDRMRNLFFSRVLDAAHPTSFREAEKVINGFPDKPPWPPNPSDEDIRSTGVPADKRIRELLLRLKCSKVPELRNKVVHKMAYRPTLSEVNHALKETREILLPLGPALKVDVNDPNWYLRQRT